LAEIAEINGGRTGRLAGLAQMGNRQVEIAEVIGHEAHEVARIRLPRPDRENLPAGHLRLVHMPRPPFGASVLDRLSHRRRWIRFRRAAHWLNRLKSIPPQFCTTGWNKDPRWCSVVNNTSQTFDLANTPYRKFRGPPRRIQRRLKRRLPRRRRRLSMTGG